MRRRLQGVAFAGHIATGVSPEEASDAGQASIEHTETLFVGTKYVAMARDEMFTAMNSLFQRFAKNGTFYTPTLVMYKASADWRDFKPNPEDRHVARSAHDAMVKVAEQYRNRPDVIAGRTQVLQTLIQIVERMRVNHVKVMVGTDLADGRIFPGYSVHEEMALLVDAGFSPLEAIQAATRLPAEFLKLSAGGTIAPGRVANALILTANPLMDIHNTRRIDSVVLRGRLFDRPALDGLLADAERLAAIN